MNFGYSARLDAVDIRSNKLTSVSSPISTTSYFYDAEIGNYHYGQGHPMKPHRVRMTHNLVVNYQLYRQVRDLAQVYVHAYDLFVCTPLCLLPLNIYPSLTTN